MSKEKAIITNMVMQEAIKAAERTAKDYVNDLFTLDPSTMQMASLEVINGNGTIAQSATAGLRLLTNRDGSIGRLYLHNNVRVAVTRAEGGIVMSTGLTVKPPEDGIAYTIRGAFYAVAPPSSSASTISQVMLGNVNISETGEITINYDVYGNSVNMTHNIVMLNGLLFFKDLGDDNE